METRNKIVIWGTSGHALVVADIIRIRRDFEIVGFLDDVNLDRHKASFSGSPILGGAEQLHILPQLNIKYLILGFGDCQARLRLSEFVLMNGFCLATALHPQAVIASDVAIGAGTVITAGAVVNSASRIGANVIINTCASVDHESDIEDGVHISPGVHLGGRVSIGKGTWIGIGATVADRIRIGEHCIIGAGSVVLNDIPDGVVAYGVPAKVIKHVERN